MSKSKKIHFKNLTLKEKPPFVFVFFLNLVSVGLLPHPRPSLISIVKYTCIYFRTTMHICIDIEEMILRIIWLVIILKIVNF